MENYSKSWDVIPLLIDSLIVQIVRSTNTPVKGVQPIRLIHPDQATLAFQFECDDKETAKTITQKLLSGHYQVEIAFFFDGFLAVETNIATISREQLNSIINKVKSDGDQTTATYIHRSQATEFINKYSTQIKQTIYTENANEDSTRLKSGLMEQFKGLFNQAIENSQKTRVEIDVYKQIWSMSDIKPDQVNRKLNKLFTLDKEMTEKKKDSKNDYKFNRHNAESSETKLSLGVFASIVKEFNSRFCRQRRSKGFQQQCQYGHGGYYSIGKGHSGYSVRKWSSWRMERQEILRQIL